MGAAREKKHSAAEKIDGAVEIKVLIIQIDKPFLISSV